MRKEGNFAESFEVSTFKVSAAQVVGGVHTFFACRLKLDYAYRLSVATSDSERVFGYDRSPGSGICGFAVVERCLEYLDI